MAGVSLNVDVSKALGKLRAYKSKLARLEIPAVSIGREGEKQSQRRLAERRVSWWEQFGNLAKDISSEVVKRGGVVYVVIGSQLQYARIQNEGSDGLPGGVVLPKKKYLAIPATKKIARSGDWPRDYARGALEFVRVMEIEIAGHRWTGPGLIRPLTEAKRGRIKRRREKLRKRIATLRKRSTRKGIPKGSEKQIELLRSLEAAKLQKDLRRQLEFALVKSVRIPGRKYLTAEATIKAVREFSVVAVRRFVLG